jgi:chitin synthase
MRFVVVLDLISTLVMPALVGYLIYLIYSIATADADTVPYISIATIAGVYGLQALLFIIKRKWEYIIWMLVSVLAIPVFSFYIPLYSYWHFDDFSWGNTRVVMGDTGKAIQVVADEGDFDPSSIPTMTWAEYEKLVLVDNGGNDYHGVDDDGLSQLSSGVYSRGYHDMSDTLSMRYPSSPPSNMGLRTASGLFTMDGSMLLPSGGSMMMPPPSSASLTMVPSSTSLLLPGQQNRYSFASTHLNALEHQPPPVSDENIRYHVHSILSTADLTQVTKKQVREQLQLIFGTSMAGKKDYINACIESSLQDRMKPY